MRRILVFQHVAWELLGTLNPLLKQAGFRIRYVNFERHPDAEPNLRKYNGLVVLGGPMNVDQVDEYPHLETETRLIRDAIARRIPVLGICLGAQLIAHALGARVYANGEKEIGWYDLSLTDTGREDPLLRGLGASERIFQWHGDTFDLPVGAEHLASSPTCTNQAFRYGDLVYGLQFHLEADQPMIERWLDVPVHREELAQLGGRIDPDQIRQETPTRIDHSMALSHKVFGAFIDLFGIPPRKRLLRSR